MTPEGRVSSVKEPDFMQLKAILQRQQSRDVAYKEAAEVGEGLLVFYEILMQPEAVNGDPRA